MASAFPVLSKVGIYIGVNLTLKRFIENGEDDTITLQVTNYTPAGHLIPSGGEGDFPVHYPILKDVGDLGEEHDELMPRQTSTSIVIDNSDDSLGFQRKFSDLLEYYTLNEQLVTIDFFHILPETSLGNISAFDTPVSTWALKAGSVSVDIERETVTIELKNSVLTDRVITKEITLSEFPDAPTSSIGRHLPLALGAEVPIIATRISDTVHALTTTFGTANPVHSVAQYYARHPRGDYAPVNSTASTSSYVIDATSLGAVDSTITLGEGFACGIDSLENCILDRFEVELKGTSTASAEGTLTLKLVECNPSAGVVGSFKQPSEYTILASASVEKSAYASSINSTSNFWVAFEFNTPAVFSPTSYLDGVTSTRQFLVLEDSDSSFPINVPIYFIDPFITFALKLNKNGIWRDISVSKVCKHRARGLTLTLTDSTTADTNGLGYSKVTLAQGGTACDITQLQLGASINGIEKSTGDLAVYPYELMPILFDNSEYENSDYFGTLGETFLDSTYGRRISGATSGRTNRLSLVREILRNSACRLISLASAGVPKVAMWCWGGTLSTSGTVDDRFCKTLRYGVGNRSSVVNNVTASYLKNVLTVTDRQLIEQGASAGYSALLGNYQLSDSTSIDLYGSNNLAQANFNYIGTEQSMQSVAEYYLRTFEHPYTYVEFYIPFCEGFSFPDKNEIPTNVLASEVLDFITPKLPAFYGTAIHPVESVTTSGDDVIEDSGFDYIRAKRYRVQIQSKRIKFINGIPVLYFICEILNNKNNPT